MTCGIYCIANSINGKVYIGQSRDVENRLSDHKTRLRGGYHLNSHLQHSFNKYGEDVFEFRLLKCCKEQYLDRFEKLFIRIDDLTNPKNGFNNETGGNINKYHSEESLRKMSEIKKCENNPMYGKHHSELSCKQISKSRNTTGFFRVYKQPNTAYKQGFQWVYKYYDENGKRRLISSTDIKKLEKKVEKKGLKWQKL